MKDHGAQPITVGVAQEQSGGFSFHLPSARRCESCHRRHCYIPAPIYPRCSQDDGYILQVNLTPLRLPPDRLMAIVIVMPATRVDTNKHPPYECPIRQGERSPLGDPTPRTFQLYTCTDICVTDRDHFDVRGRSVPCLGFLLPVYAGRPTSKYLHDDIINGLDAFRL